MSQYAEQQSGFSLLKGSAGLHPRVHQPHNAKPGTNLQQNKQLKSEILTFGHMYTDNAHVREPVKHNSLRMKIYISTMYALYEYIYIHTPSICI